MGSFSMAVPDVMVDASVAERSRANPELTADLQVFCWITYAFGALFAVAFKGTILSWTRSVRGLYALLTAASTLIVLPAGMGWLGEPRKRKREVRASFSSMSTMGAAPCNSLSRGLDSRTVSLGSRTASVGSRGDSRGARNGRSARGGELWDTGAVATCYRPPAGVVGIGTVGTDRAGADGRGLAGARGFGCADMFVLGGALAVGSILLSSLGLLFDDRDLGVPLAAIAIGVSLCAVVWCLESRVSPTLAKSSLYLFLEGVSAANPQTTVAQARPRRYDTRHCRRSSRSQWSCTNGTRPPKTAVPQQTRAPGPNPAART